MRMRVITKHAKQWGNIAAARAAAGARIARDGEAEGRRALFPRPKPQDRNYSNCASLCRSTLPVAAAGKAAMMRISEGRL